ncbi:LOW QUALITY PROTEIN: Hypothetical protein PHPALM_9648, partial [Phytophthora palmivora]
MASPQPRLVAYVSGLKVEPPKASELYTFAGSKWCDYYFITKIHRGSIKMEQMLYSWTQSTIDHATYKEHFSGKPIVVVLDNAPAH